MATTPTPPPDRDLTDPVDAALAGALSRAGEDLGEVPADVARGHLDAITAQAVVHAHTAPVPARRTGSTRVGRLRVRRLAGMTTVKIALGAGVAAAGTTGGLAATGNLPDPVQQVVSDGAGWIGIDVPAPADEAEEALEQDEDGQPSVDAPRPGADDDTGRLAPPRPPAGPDDDVGGVSSGDRDVPPDDRPPGPPAEDAVPLDRPASGDRSRPSEQPDREDHPTPQDRSAHEDRSAREDRPAAKDRSAPADRPAAKDPRTTEDRPAPPDGQAGRADGAGEAEADGGASSASDTGQPAEPSEQAPVDLGVPAPRDGGDPR